MTAYHYDGSNAGHDLDLKGCNYKKFCLTGNFSETVQVINMDYK